MPDESKPEPPTAWEGKMILIYPNGEQSDMDLNGSVARPGEPFPGKPGYVLDRFDVTDKPVTKNGLYGVVGILRDAADEQEDAETNS